MKRLGQISVVAVSATVLSVAMGHIIPPPGAVAMRASPYSLAHSGLYTRLQRAVQRQQLPIPRATVRVPQRLSLREAILLALRNNPAVENAELQRVVDKFALVVAHNVFMPQFDISGSGAYQRGAKPDYAIGPNVNLKTPIGTEIHANYGNAFTGSPGTVSLGVTQHLLKGGGWAVNTAPLAQAVVGEKIARLNFKNSVIAVIVNVINTYRTLVQDYNNLTIQRRAVTRAQQTVHQSKLKVQAGKVAPSDLLQQQSNLATTRLTMMQQKNSLQNDYQLFLQALGLVATAKINIDKTLKFTRCKIPSLKTSIQLALGNNIDYQAALMQIRADKLSLITAKNQARWRLDVSANTSVGRSSGTVNLPPSSSGDGGSGFSVNGASVGFNVDIPINNVNAKQQIIQARIQLEQAKVRLQQTKQQLVSNVINLINQLNNQYQQIKVATQAVRLQQQTLNNARIKLKYGKSTVFEVNELQDQLLQQQTSLISNKIQFLNLITIFNQTLGITLEKWGIALRY